MSYLHHAALVSSESIEDYCIDEHCLGSEEIIDQYIDRFGIDNVRELTRLANQRPDNAEWKLLVLRSNFITHEAQNALLKILEEPPVSSRFIFILPPDISLLPTLLSRFGRVETKKQVHSDFSVFEEFVNSSYADRLSAIEMAVKKKDLFWQKSIKQGLRRYLANKDNRIKNLSDYEFVARLLLTRGSANKMLLEHLALVLP